MHTCFAGWCRAGSNYRSSRRWECLGCVVLCLSSAGGVTWFATEPSDVGGVWPGLLLRETAIEIPQAALESLRGLGRQVAALRSHSTVAWCEAVQARRCPALHTTAGRGSLSGCARPRAAGRTAPVPRRRPGDVMRRKGPADRCSKAVLLRAGRLGQASTLAYTLHSQDEGRLCLPAQICDLLAG